MTDQAEQTEHTLPTPTALAAMTIEAVLARWPQTAVTFHQHNMACVGCAVASYYTISDAIRVYGLSGEHFLNELIAAINRQLA